MTSSLSVPINAEQRAAIRRIAAFRQRFGEGHFYLACHAALPLALTPDLLYCLWVNFQQDSHQELLDIPWIAVSDLILSNLCEEVGYELYEMDTPTRNELLKQLQHDSRFGLKRIHELADFVMTYVEQQLNNPDLDTQDFAQTQQWRALAYKDPTESAREIASAISQIDKHHKTEWLRFTALLGTIAEPLAEFQTLLIYIQMMADLSKGKTKTAREKASLILNSTKQIQVCGVKLAIPGELLVTQSLAPKPFSKLFNSKTPFSVGSFFVPLSVIAAGALVIAILRGNHLPLPQSCPQSQQKINDVCTAVSSFPEVPSYRTFAEVPNVPQGVFNYGGSTTFAPLRSPTIVSTISRAYPQFQLRYTEPTTGNPGSGTGIGMLIDGQLSFAQSARSIKDAEYAKAKNRGFALEAVPVAIDGIALYVNPRLINQGVKGLTLAQVRDIFTGKIRNWQAVGGPNLVITPFSRSLQSGGTVDFFYENIMEKQPLSANVNEVRDTTESIRQVATAEGGIGYATASEVTNQPTIRLVAIAREEDSQALVSPCADDTCVAINKKGFADGSYPITRRLFVIIERGSGHEQAGVAYANLLLSDEGQQLVEQAGFVPIR